jgi:putative ABC transport system permease protein
MLNSLNLVVLVMITCAAALAFVVLYNLTNINIAERVREIATFKVLGFNNRETSSFIYKENIVLTLLGIAVGLVLGIFLTSFIVQTVEVENYVGGE